MPITVLCLYKAAFQKILKIVSQSIMILQSRGAAHTTNSKTSNRKTVDLIMILRSKLISNFVNHISSIIRLTFPMNALHDAITNILQNE